MERNIAGGGGKISAVVTATVPPASLISLIPGCLSQFFRFLLQQLIQRFFHASAYQLLKLTLDYFFIYDFTKDQYKDNNISFQNVQNVPIATLLENYDTRCRYELLKERLIRIEKSFWEINDLILNCQRCCNVHAPAFETVSLGTKCEILVVGEAPAKNGWRLTGKAWINEKGSLVPTGKTLQKLLNRIGLDIDQISFIEAIKCYPERGKVTKEHIVNCKDFCYRQIDILKPQIILSMGKYATEYLLGTKENFSEMVGNTYLMTISNSIYTVIPIYHTSPASPLSYKGNLEVFEKIKQLIAH